MSTRSVSASRQISAGPLHVAGWLSIAFSLVALAEVPATVAFMPYPPIWTITLDTLRPLAVAYAFWVFKGLLNRRRAVPGANLFLWALIVLGIIQLPIQAAPLWAGLLGATLAFPTLSFPLTVLYGLALIGLGGSLARRDVYWLTKPLGVLLAVAGLYPFVAPFASSYLYGLLLTLPFGPQAALLVVGEVGYGLVAAPSVLLGLLLLRAARSST